MMTLCHFTAAAEAGQVYGSEYMTGGAETSPGDDKQSGCAREKGLKPLKNYTQAKSMMIKL